ncbi:MAG: hypothetical protein DYG83_10325 [Candidatus Brocadia sp. AMX2]|uniref:Bifunctional DNA primase/polymerase n=1 Tax=Candidatus Brocadia sinica JPN1 TaxID=1197129 RepID=A0ABQ0JYE1_9BACT|nr:MULTISPECIES: bifunctional DNA primase/polymerase [Brocadia]MBC6932880.1 hypothetical protein [Candidatus Brocadia sp.]MBL1167634.1 hypothetical protein [Candidatus Brocadia sp. AMX1]NOG40474.1 hypothetical protein [Planctomycetota bacterium]NUO06274.1 bifunctional DNA primase/polymerase [Candidatus Brocadia sinica]KAA0242095.1 MAG: hypothetical protein EDM70_15725 [Candidatus Brocadia sp. AMX2]
MKTLDAALMYLEQGFPVIPMSPTDKKPLVKWAEFQTRMPSEQETKEMFSKYSKAMIGLVTGKISGICVIDCDSSEACEKIDFILPEMFESPIAVSPRGGRHYYFQCPEDLQTKTAVFSKVDVRANGGVIIAPPSINSQGKKYSWLNVSGLTRDALQPMPSNVIETLSQPPGKCARPHGSAPLNKNTLYIEGVTTNLTTPFANGRRDNDLFAVANGLVKSGIDINLASEVLRRLILSWGEEVDEKWVNDKIESALKRQEKRDGKFSDEVKEWILSSNGVFLSSDVVKCLQVSSRDEQKNLSKILSRLCEEGVIERHGEKNGCFRKIKKDYEVIDLSSVSINPLPIVWPFGIHEKVYVLPKSVAVVAGETDAGKTALCLNFACMNRERMKVRFLTSEMSGEEIKSRTLPLGVPESEWKKIEFIERSCNFQDLILPDGLTIVDYVEKSENFYEIARDIKEIFDRLKTGFVLIALQKKAGQEFGRGGDFSAEKARLYLSMSPGRLKIVKAKNWVKPDVNPNRMECEFKLVGGIKFIQTSGWRRPN